MRDYQETNKYEDFQVDTVTITSGKCNGQTSVQPSGYISTFPVLAKGRGDLKTGPSPFPTNYFGFRMQSQPIFGEALYTSSRSWVCGWYNSTERQRITLLPSSMSGLVVSTGMYTQFQESGHTGYHPNVSPETIGEAVKIANSKLRSDSINIGQTIGEMPEALRELSKFVGGVGKTLIALKKGNVRRAQFHLGTVLGRRRALETTQGISNAYLFYRFGVAPILNDINNMMAEIGKAFQAPDFIKVKATRRESREPSNPAGWWVKDADCEEICEVGYNVRPKPHYPAAFLGLTNPIAVAWELVPLSFIANWFVSIGDVLNALDAGVGLDFVSGYQTNVVKGSYTVYKPLNVRDMEYKMNTFAMERWALNTPTLPPLYIKFRGLNPGKLLTISALLVSKVNPRNLKGTGQQMFK